MLFPNKTKYRKSQKGTYPRGTAIKGNNISFGMYGIKTIECGLIKASQIESTRKALVRKTKRVGSLWIRIFPDIPVTKKPIEVRMGKGKGVVDHWLCKVKAGRILFELDGISKTQATEAFEYAKAKLPIKTKLISKQ